MLRVSAKCPASRGSFAPCHDRIHCRRCPATHSIHASIVRSCHEQLGISLKVLSAPQARFGLESRQEIGMMVAADDGHDERAVARRDRQVLGADGCTYVLRWRLRWESDAMRR